jgi:divalent metal cation (Fe/Co/Zn/Cd) transporter
MKVGTLIAMVVALVLLLYGTVAVYEAFDRNSHSASDAIRPFVITMGQVWALAIAAATVLLRGRGTK